MATTHKKKGRCGSSLFLLGVALVLVGGAVALVPPSLSAPGGRLSSSVRCEAGKLALVGAGPGDPELLTVAALRYISDERALVIADRLVSEEVLALVRGELRVARKRPGCAEEAQRQIYEWIRQGLAANRTVIRLKIGDPFIFGRGAEELLEVLHHPEEEDDEESSKESWSSNVEVRVVPGVSAAFAAPLAAGVPLTHRGVADKVVLTTGFGRDGSEPELPFFQPKQTVVMLMGVGRLGAVADTFVRSKNFPTTMPALVVEKATCHQQRVVIGDLADIHHIVQRHAIKAPATIVVGDVVRVLYPNQPHGLVTDASAIGSLLSSRPGEKEEEEQQHQRQQQQQPQQQQQQQRERQLRPLPPPLPLKGAGAAAPGLGDHLLLDDDDHDDDDDDAKRRRVEDDERTTTSRKKQPGQRVRVLTKNDTSPVLCRARD